MKERRILFIGLGCMVLIFCIFLCSALSLGWFGIKDNFSTPIPYPSMVVDQ